MLVLQAALAVVCFGGLLLLPGLGLQTLWELRPAHRHRPAERQVGPDAEVSAMVSAVTAVGLSLLVVAVVAYVMVGLSVFTGSRVAAAVAPLAVVGLWRLPSLVRHLAGSAITTVCLLVLAVPFASPAWHAGNAPVNNFNWYYWNLGRDLTRAGGVPGWVSEYGMHLRWQPDYLTFNVLTEAFRGAFVAASPLTSLSMWKVPVAILTVAMTYAALRLWFRAPVALAGTALATVTTLYTAKLGNARPEILGFTLGLVALVIAVDAQRRVRPAGYVLAASVLAVATSVHAIGALIGGVLLAGATLCEVVRSRPLLVPRMLMALGGVGVFAAVVATTGWALQGRVFAGGDAAHPSLVNGSDPTLTYFELSEGLTGRPDVGDRLTRQLIDVVPRLTLAPGSLWYLVAAVLLLIGLSLAMGGRGARQAAIVTGGLAAFLVLGVSWFALRYDTFVPQNTGLSRFTQWSPLVVVLAVACTAEVVVERFGRAAQPAAGAGSVQAASWPRRVVVGSLCIALATGWALLVSTQFPPRLPLAADAVSAIDHLRDSQTTGGVVLTNLTTHGLLEYNTPAEVPVEGRQPVIEDVRVLERTNAYLRRTTAYFTHPVAASAVSRFGARWVLVTDSPESFGAARTLGPPRSRLPLASGLHLVWRSPHTALYSTTGGTGSTTRTGPARMSASRVLVGLVVVLLVAGVALLGLSRAVRARVTADPVDDPQ